MLNPARPPLDLMSMREKFILPLSVTPSQPHSLTHSLWFFLLSPPECSGVILLSTCCSHILLSPWKHLLLFVFYPIFWTYSVWPCPFSSYFSSFLCHFLCRCQPHILPCIASSTLQSVCFLLALPLLHSLVVMSLPQPSTLALCSPSLFSFLPFLLASQLSFSPSSFPKLIVYLILS